jgi:type I restriction enzyme M protein
MQHGSVKAPRGVAVVQSGSGKERDDPVAALDEPVDGLSGPVFMLSLKDLTLPASPSLLVPRLFSPLPALCRLASATISRFDAGQTHALSPPPASLMNQNEFKNIEKMEAELWDAADNLRANSKLTAGEYCMPVLGVIFLRHATNRYRDALTEIQAAQAAGKMPKRPLSAADFKKRRALMLPKEARYDELLALPQGADLGAALVEAMNAIERDFEPLAGQLPKEYAKFENTLLEDLLRVFDSETLRTASGDVFGRINEYFLMKFAMQGAQDNGEFFTPPSLVKTIVNVIEPDHGVVFDPACGSGGMFVQSSHFIEQHGQSAGHRVTFFGQEYKTSNLRLAKMNLAVHALEGAVVEANTFYLDEHELYGKCDFVMANPPFNVDKVDAEKVKDDRRLPFGLPGVNKDKKVSNGNYLWISYFWSYLNKTGRAGFVMSSQASSAGHGEMEVRRKLVETGDVDVMISIRSNFFYTRSVPCELWFFDRSKPKERRDQVLMLDARHVYRKVTRKIYDFSPEQQQNLSSIVWLYRGESERFVELVGQHLDCALQSAHACFMDEYGAVKEPLDEYLQAMRALEETMTPFLKGIKKKSACEEALGDFLAAENDPKGPVENFRLMTSSAQKQWNEAGDDIASYQDLDTHILGQLAEESRSLITCIDQHAKHAAKLISLCESELEAAKDEKWNKREVAKALKAAEAARQAAVEQLKHVRSFERHAHWLLTRFPDAKLVDVPGLVKLVSRKDIEAADWSLTPGRYVGVAPAEVDEDFDFEQTLGDIHVELADLNKEAAALAKKIQKNFEGLGI